MDPTTKEIEWLYNELMQCHRRSDFANAKPVAERLATALGELTPESVKWYVHHWILVWETRGNLEEACRLQDEDIVRKRREIESGDFDAFTNLLTEQVEYLQNSLYLQALRYEEHGNRHAAIDCLREVYDLGRRYGIGPGEDTQAFYVQLMSSDDPSASF